ncbi:hypothetical protein A4D02_08915 [Niastella koreensis]|uniref:Uncharacterized protein n=2 Tax=Niastella koreensis TaxID=354356 RepID=G8TQB2_NIAKG|nr:hypothetical protein [Niastella koreensis]AEW02126.1 hypothetical protein Niako_5896 [Niastella koreensis GR20-10]OQP48812.1 hypothetical protein A4D02_08915 [Niastella koreensis]
MDNLTLGLIDYFQAPHKYFWRWADGGQVIEWRDGDTICYRDELMPILKHLSKDGLPAFGAILLVISACKERADTPAAKGGIPMSMLRLLDYQQKNSEKLGGMKDQMLKAIRFLQYVAALPLELRTGNNRTWLLHLVFGKVAELISIEAASQLVDVFNSGQYDYEIFREPPYDYDEMGDEVSGNHGGSHVKRTFSQDIEALHQALMAFPTAQELEVAVRSGIRKLPQAVALEIPSLETGDLLEQLEEDDRTTGLVQLTKRLIAALNIPMHAHGSSDQLFGGVSDITNRGNFDRLLLSELAHDDLSLMARLANNEALYLRREELPSNPEKQRILLVDTTLKMWGLPRVFAVSAALACAHNNKAKARIASYALSGTGYYDIDLTTKDGVVNALEQLDAALHCGRGLSQFVSQQAMREEDEVFLITEEAGTHGILFQSILASLKKPVNFLVTVSRSGELRFYEYIKGRKKQLSEARFDLQELLFPATAPKKEKSVRKNRSLLHAPAFMQYLPGPLFLPASKIKFNADCFFEVKKNHLVCVTIDQRVLYWNNRMRGAREIIEYLEFGQICFGSAGDTTLYILVYSGGPKYVRLYEVDLESGTVEITKLPDTITGLAEMVFDEGYFYVKTANELFAIEASTGKAYPGKDRIGVFTLMLERNRKAFGNVNLNFYKKFVNEGYTTINTVKGVYLNADGELGFDERHISLRSRSEKINEMIVIEQNRQEKGKNTVALEAIKREMPVIDLPNTYLKFSRFIWPEGSEVVADSRGLLHLKSADSSIGEITIVMIVGKPTACWSSDGNVCGSPYFTGKAGTEGAAVTAFYENYIQRFIDRIKKYATNA